MRHSERWGALSFAQRLAGCLLAVACSGFEQGGETVFVLGQAQQPVLMEGTVFGDGLSAKTVILTYDDGPDEHTLELAQYLHDNGIRATFFINGRRICKTLVADGSCLVPVETRSCDNGLSQAPVTEPIYYPESLLHQVVQLGHRIANHTVDHCHLQAQDNPEDFVFELQGTQEIIDRHICDGLFLFRAPYGEWDPQAAALAQAEPGLDKLVGPIQWDIDGLDWSCYQQGTAIETCGDGYLNILRARPQQNGIFLLHDRPEYNVGSDGPLLLAQYMVPLLQSEGFQFSTLETLLGHTSETEMACPFDDGLGGMNAGGGGSGGVAGSSAAGGGAGVTAQGGAAGGSISIAGAGSANDAAAGSGGGADAAGTGGDSTALTPGGAGGTGVAQGATDSDDPTRAREVEQTANCALIIRSDSRHPARVSLLVAMLLGTLVARRRRSAPSYGSRAV